MGKTDHPSGDQPGAEEHTLQGMNYLPYLRAWRLYRGKGLLEFSRESGVSRTALVDLEAQRQRATIPTLNKLAKALKVKPSLLVFVNPEDLPEEGRGAA